MRSGLTKLSDSIVQRQMGWVTLQIIHPCNLTFGVIVNFSIEMITLTVSRRDEINQEILLFDESIFANLPIATASMHTNSITILISVAAISSIRSGWNWVDFLYFYTLKCIILSWITSQSHCLVQLVRSDLHQAIQWPFWAFALFQVRWGATSFFQRLHSITMSPFFVELTWRYDCCHN